ncbi:MAG: hypothetical protein MJ166_11635 [Clostridia bacterium]|nr:hypothetical protein [Clostridia bacterium]
MNSIENWESIDYSELIEALKDDISAGMLSPDTELYIVREKTQVKISGKDLTVQPVVEYFYDEPALQEKLNTMTILDLKKCLYEAKEQLASCETSPMQESLAETQEIMIQELSDYTKGRSKRNDENCLVIFAKATSKTPYCPLMFFYETDDTTDTLEKISVEALLTELIACSEEK